MRFILDNKCLSFILLFHKIRHDRFSKPWFYFTVDGMSSCGINFTRFERNRQFRYWFIGLVREQTVEGIPANRLHVTILPCGHHHMAIGKAQQRVLVGHIVMHDSSEKLIIGVGLLEGYQLYIY